jgi:ATP-binding cassette subfamily D (ALD) long-chain fatty acid import protein
MPVFSKPLKPPPCRSLTIALIVVLILRIRLLTLPKDVAISLSGMLKGKEKQRFTEEGLAAVFQQAYLDDLKGGPAGSRACDPRSFVTFSFQASTSL